MDHDPSSDRINSFALVTYISDRLGDFLTKLRDELIPGSSVRAHVTILPPRPIRGDGMTAGHSMRRRIESYAPFTIEINDIDVFAVTAVVFAEIGIGRKDLRRIHEELNIGPVEYHEPYPYHPHITLAQNIDPKSVPEIYQLARRRWQEAGLPKRFIIDTMHFVQNTAGNRWIDLMSYELDGDLEGELSPVRVRR
jgi:2'-5' RNA ligase